MKTKSLPVFTYIALLLMSGVAADMIKNISVPHFSFAGDRVNVTCVFNLSDPGLYSMKWYHNDAEFYRLIPTENTRPVHIKSGLKFNVYEISRSDRHVTLELASLTSDASGEYRCEVIAEHPSFRTESKSSNMTVMEEEPLAPLIMGARESYEEEDEVKLKCIPQPPRSSTGQKYTLSWFIDGAKARSDFLTPYRESSLPHQEGLELTATARELASLGSTIDMECHLKLGDFDISTHQKVRIRVKKSNIFANYWSKGDVAQPLVTLTFILAYFNGFYIHW